MMNVIKKARTVLKVRRWVPAWRSPSLQRSARWRKRSSRPACTTEFPRNAAASPCELAAVEGETTVAMLPGFRPDAAGHESRYQKSHCTSCGDLVTTKLRSQLSVLGPVSGPGRCRSPRRADR